MLGIEDNIKRLQHELESFKRLAELNESIIEMMYIWLNNPSDRSMEKVFEELNFRKIAIYGYSRLGRILINQLGRTNIDVEYIIDRNRELKLLNHKVYYVDENIPKVDAIVVSNIYDFDEIKDCIEDKVKNIPVISLAEILCML